MTKFFKTMLIISTILVVSMPLYAKTDTSDNLETGDVITIIDDKTDLKEDQTIDADPIEYTAVRSRHQHRLGGGSESAGGGLAVAAGRSEAIAPGNFKTKK